MSQPAGRRSSPIRDQLAVLSIAEGFFQSNILQALLKLDLFERIGESGKSLTDLAGELKTTPNRAGRLLNAGVALKLIETKDGSFYTLPPASISVLLRSAGENYLGDWIRNLGNFEQTLATLDEAVVADQPEEYLPFASGQEQTREFTLAMHNYASLRGKELTHYLDTRGCHTLLDVGCGPGTHAFLFGLANPELRLFLMDDPAVLSVAKEVQSRYGLKNEVNYLPGDVTTGKLSGQYDLVLVSNMLHMLGPDASRDLLKRLFCVVAPGGSLVVQAQFLRDDRLGDRWPLLLDLLQLCLTPAGQNHSVSETKEWLREAGFSDIEYRQMSVWNTNSFLRAWRR